MPPKPGDTAKDFTLRTQLHDQHKLATTVGYGPRFLHSTSQLQNGDRDNGLIIQFTSSAHSDAAIADEAGQPESTMSFGVLKLAQALGDVQALLDAGRRVALLDAGRRVARLDLRTAVANGVRWLKGRRP
jgi:transaldolase/glucose-6-phosphate isomerase